MGPRSAMAERIVQGVRPRSKFILPGSGDTGSGDTIDNYYCWSVDVSIRWLRAMVTLGWLVLLTPE